MVRHTNGRYHGRLYRDGKEKWQGLATRHLSVAEDKLAELQKEYREHPNVTFRAGNARMTFGEASRLHEYHLAGNARLGRILRNITKLKVRSQIALP